MERIKLDLKVSRLGIFLNIAAVIAFIGALSFILINWSTLPESVPSHYNALGEADDWGSRGVIFVPLAIGVLIWVLFSILEKYPHLHNYPEINEKNVTHMYKNSMLMLNVIKNELMIIFSFSAINDVFVSKGKGSLIGAWEMPIVLGLIFGTIFVFLLRTNRISKIRG